jgi:hypothetical protein
MATVLLHHKHGSVNVTGDLHAASQNVVVVTKPTPGASVPFKTIWQDGNGRTLSRGEALVLLSRLSADRVLRGSSLLVMYPPDN